MSKICPKCNKEWPDEFLSCPLDGTLLVPKTQESVGFSVNLGDANAISGGVQMSDNHSVSHNTVTTTTNTVDSHNVITNHITQVEHAKSPEEIRRENMKIFRDACQDVFKDGVQTSEEKRRLDELQFQLGLDEETAARIVESVRSLSTRKSAILGPVQQITFNNIKTAIQSNRTDVVERLLPQLKAMVQKFSAEDLQYTYYMLQAVMTPDKCVRDYELPHEDKYWQTFWASVAYRRIGDIEHSEILVVDVGDKWIDTIPQENVFVLATVNALIDGEMETAKSLYDQITGEHSPLLSTLVGCLYALIYHDLPLTGEIKKMALTGKFYTENLFKSLCAKLDQQKKELEAAKRKAEEEIARQKAEEEIARQKAEEEAKRKAAEEARRKAEEEAERQRKEAEEAKRKAEEEAKRKVEEEKRRKVEAIKAFEKMKPAQRKELDQIDIPEGVTDIKTSFFLDCEKLRQVTIPASVSYIGDEVFNGCSSLATIIVARENQNFCVIDDVLYSKDMTRLIRCSIIKKGALAIPENVKSIDLAFECSEGLSSITIPDSVTRIKGSTFINCKKLQSVKLPKHLTSLGSFAFSGCESLKEINISEGVTIIEEFTFAGCKNLKKITIPEGVTTIEDFAFEGCAKLTTITLPSSLYNVGNFALCCAIEKIVVPAGKSAYFKKLLKPCFSPQPVPVMEVGVDSHVVENEPRKKAPIQARVCPSCGREVSSTAAFCKYCGESLSKQPERTCPNCGNKLSAEARFCNKCGTKINRFL